MRILYGIQTTGNGHISRSSLLVKYLKEQGCEVKVLFSGAGSGGFWNTEVFEPYSRYKGLTFVTRNGKIDTLQTAFQLEIGNAFKDINAFRDRNFDLVLSDFEPLSVRIARRFGIPSMGVSHQCAFSYDIPKARFNPMGKIVTKVFAPVDINVGLHWDAFGQPLLPPIVEASLCAEDISRAQGKILVYLPFENHDKVRNALHRFRGHRFHIYEKRERLKQDGNLVWCPFSREGFKNDLLSCDGVICQSGFELPSEAFHIGKKVLVKPVYGQFEQLSNAMVVERLGLGMAMKSLDRNVIAAWLELPHPQAANYPDVALETAKWISREDWNDLQGLSQRLWQGDQKQISDEEKANAA